MKMRKTTFNKIELILNALIFSDTLRSEGDTFADISEKTVDNIKRKILDDKTNLNFGIYIYCEKNKIPWKKDYRLDNICKTSRQLNYLTSELKYYLEHRSKKNLECNTHQMEFDFS